MGGGSRYPPESQSEDGQDSDIYIHHSDSEADASQDIDIDEIFSQQCHITTNTTHTHADQHLLTTKRHKSKTEERGTSTNSTKEDIKNITKESLSESNYTYSQ